VQTPRMDLVVQLIQQGSDLLVFALFSYIGKYPEPFSRECQPLLLLLSIFSEWQLHEFNFIRPGRDPFPPYVTKTIMVAVGTLMKLLYEKA
jgi:hypothetical protein